MLNSLLQMIRELVADGARRGARQLRARNGKARQSSAWFPLADKTLVQIRGKFTVKLLVHDAIAIISLLGIGVFGHSNWN